MESSNCKNISIIIPHYNSVDTLRTLLNSIPNKDDIEVIVVDDHSDVDISELAVEFMEVDFYKQEDGLKWAGAARNLALKKAKGKYLLFADSDDFFLHDAFDIINEYIEKEFDIVFFSPTSQFIEDKMISDRHTGYALLVDDFIKDGNDEIKYKFHVPWSKLILRSLVVSNSIQFDEVIASNDVNFSLKCSFYARRIHADSRKIYCVVESLNSLTKIKSEAVIDSRFEALCRYNDFLSSHKYKARQGAMSGHLFNALSFGPYKFLYRFFYCKYQGYPIFYSLKHLIRAFRKTYVGRPN